jgi:hypothetical protein
LHEDIRKSNTKNIQMSDVSISKIENFFYNLLSTRLHSEGFSHVFAEELPISLPEDTEQYVVIDCTSAISDLVGIGTGIVRIWLYVAPNTVGTKNVKVMNEMETKLKSIINNDSYVDTTYHVSLRDTYADYDGTRHLFCNIVEVRLQINNN